MSYNDDVSHLWWGIGPQLDGLGHVGESGVYYNCSEGTDFASVTGLQKFGIHNVPPLVGRGVLLDMAEYFGVETMAGGQAIDAADIQAAAAEQNVEIRRGDIVLFHTGWTDAMLTSDPDTWVATEPGITNDGATYLASLEPMAVRCRHLGCRGRAAGRGRSGLLRSCDAAEGKRNLQSSRR